MMEKEDLEVRRKRRDQRVIAGDILILLIKKGRALKTQIMYGANLSFHQLETYLELLLDADLIKTVTKGGKTHYLPTDRAYLYNGLSFLMDPLLSPNDEVDIYSDTKLVKMVLNSIVPPIQKINKKYDDLDLKKRKSPYELLIHFKKDQS